MAAPHRRAALALCVVAGACAASDEKTGNEVDRNAVARELGRLEVQPGLWEVTSEIVSVSEDEMPREIAEQMKSRRRAGRYCVTAEQAAHPDANFLRASAGRGCIYSAFEMRAGRISGEMVCRAPDGVETHARMSGRYGPVSYELRSDVETPGIARGRTMTLTTRQTARRVGDCPRDPAGVQAR